MKQTNSFTKLGLTLSVTLALTAAIGFSSAQAQTYKWQGSSGASANDVTASANYNGTVPTYNATNATGSFYTEKGSSDFDYTSAQGTTTFGNNTASSANALTWLGWSTAGTGGTANTSNVNVTGGTLNLNGLFTNEGGSEGLWVGNGGATANLVLNGGNVNVTNGTLLGRDNSKGTLSITNGTFTTGTFSSAIGTYIGAALGGGSATSSTGNLTIGNGGEFSLTGAAANPFDFGGLFASATNTGVDFINFTLGSTGNISLNLSSTTLGSSYFSNLITNGYVKINGVTDANTADYSINTSNLSASTLGLAAVPEPSTWALFFGGFATLFVIQRKRFLQV